MTATSEPTDGGTDKGQRIGPFVVIGPLGGGSQGTVYLAEQREPVFRRVALKVLTAALPAPEHRARFEAERQALALMTHHNVARVFESGVTPDGRPWLAIELVQGDAITKHCERYRLGLEERLRLFVDVCRGVQHAHQKGVVHRDLKPSNILVGEDQGRPVPKIVDFGIAKSLERPLSVDALTEPGQLVGTLEYMSPEQAENMGRAVDTRSDVYALGVVLYELLVGQPPFTRVQLVGSGLQEMQRLLREVDPPRPSTRVTGGTSRSDRTTGTRTTRPASLRRTLRNELDWIVMKALEKDPTRRYQTAAELARDVERFLEGDPVEARPPSLAYRLRKLVRRHRTHVTWATAAATLLVAAGAALLMSWHRAARLEQLALEGRLQALLADKDRTFPLAERSAAGVDRWLTNASLLAEAKPRLRALADSLGEDVDGDTRNYLISLLGRLDRFTQPQIARARAEADEDPPDPSLSKAKPVTAYATAWMRVRQERLRTSTLNHPNWAIARRAGLDMAPIEGLIPLVSDAPDKCNPATHLWEFVHPGSGRPGAPVPEYVDAKGHLRFTADTGLVFVRVPTGSLPRSDGSAVAMPSFLISKYEMDRGQYYWLSEGRRPSTFWSHGDDTMPVESIQLDELLDVLAANGLALPATDQWEYAARAGTTDEYAGFARETLVRAVNLADRSFAAQQPGAESPEDWDDGFGRPASVDAMQPNDWGLHHVLGNVWERCVRGDAVYLRGGGYGSPLANCTVSEEARDLRDGRSTTGLRPIWVSSTKRK